MENQSKLSILNELKQKSGISIDEWCENQTHFFKANYGEVEILASFSHTDSRVRKQGAAKEFLNLCAVKNILTKL